MMGQILSHRDLSHIKIEITIFDATKSISMELAEVKLYRMTHIDNMEHILENGITHRNSPNNNPDYKSIGDVSLINTRDNKRVFVDNGDFENSDAPGIILGDFIPFYFGLRMPMLYVIQNGGNFVINPTSPSKIIYLVCSLSKMIKNQKIIIFQMDTELIR
ncbi:MAG: DarT ssDNA thymidine ADP-ribosyltransferase family protein [Ferruginibacter sp.]